MVTIFGKAYPVQPISSKKPAGIPNAMPTKKLPGAKIGETKIFMQERTTKIKQGGMNSGAYQYVGTPTRRIRENRSCRPLLPSTIRVKRSPAVLGPRSMTGNINSPLNFDTGSPLIRLGDATARAPSQEIANVSKK